jgi:MFS family permease
MMPKSGTSCAAEFHRDTEAGPAMRTQPFFGWRVVTGAFVLAVLSWGFGFYGMSIYLQAVHTTRGWPVLIVSSAVTAHFLAGALFVANLPSLHRRFGLARVTRAGACALAAGVLGWAMATAPWQLFAATLLSGAGWGVTSGAALNAIVAPWFDRERPAALSAAYNGASIGGVVFAPLWVFGIAQMGFPLAAATLGLVMAATVWILAGRLFARVPRQMGLTPDGHAGPPAATTRTRMPVVPPLRRDRRFLTLAVGMALGLFAQIGMVAHLFSLLVPALGVQYAGWALGLAPVFALIGRTVTVWLMPAGADRRLVAAASYAVQVLGLFAFVAAAGESVPLLLAGVVLFGFGIGNATSLPPLIAQAEFAPEQVPRVVALTVAASQATYAFAPAAIGLVREIAPAGAAAGDAPHVFAAVALAQTLAVVAFLAGRGPAPVSPGRPAG